MNKFYIAIAFLVVIGGAGFLLLGSPVVPVLTVPLVTTKTDPDVLPQNAGYLSGHVTVGPICPVERVDHPCVASAEVYTSREVVVFTSDGTTELKRVHLDAKGNYKLPIATGYYFLQIQPAGIGAGVKKAVTVKSGETAETDFDIDTGIR